MLKASNNISYQGNVNITHKINGRKITNNYKNNGTLSLFNLITKALAGYDISQNIPKLLRIVDSNGTIGSKYCPLTGIIYGNNTDTSYLSCTCVLTKDDIINKSLSSPQLTLADYSGNTLAYIDISQDTFRTISTDGLETDIIWELQFGNGTLLGSGE